MGVNTGQLGFFLISFLVVSWAISIAVDSNVL
jgi:hypothetical protein